MNSLIGILKLDSNQIHLLLSNHEMFTKNEVKLAAKIKVKRDRAKSLNHLYHSHWVAQQDPCQLMRSTLNVAQSNPYTNGFGGGLFSRIF